MNAAALFPRPLSAPAVRMPAVDATRDNTRPVARTLEQCAGHQRSSCACIVSMDEPVRMHRADRIVTIASALGGLALLGMGLAGWLQ